jgi:hypothetical protein
MAGISEMCSPHTLVVNKAGQRFADESYFQSVVPALRKFDTLRHAYANLPVLPDLRSAVAKSYSLAHLPVGAAVRPRSRATTRLRVSPPSSASTTIGLDRTIERFNGLRDLAPRRGFQRVRCAGGWRIAPRRPEKYQPRRPRPAAVLRA